MNDAESALRSIFAAAIRAVDPGDAVLRQAERVRARYAAAGCRRLLVLGFGKAAVPMGAAVEAALADLAPAGIVITKEGFGQPGGLRRLAVREASHPVPDSRGVAATAEIIRLAGEADDRTLVLVLISGGGSALLVAPAAGLSLADKQATTSLLLRAGADIGELNAVRKHLSLVKGGRLAELLYPAPALSLVISDVPGDRLDVIASGPTVPDSTTFPDAMAVIEKFGLAGAVPPSVRDHLRRGVAGDLPETPTRMSRVFRSVEVEIVANLGMALHAARREAERIGFRTALLSEPTVGEAREAGRQLALRAQALKSAGLSDPPLCLISGGETTVTVRGAGRGGRNQELALAFARQIEGAAGITLLAAGTDGNDGPTDAAGAIVDGTTCLRGRRYGSDPERALEENDSWTYFHRIGGLFITGPTGTNVMDLQIVLVA